MQQDDRAPDSPISASRLALVASRTINGVIITDAARRIEWANEGFTRITGYTLDEVKGKVPGHILQGPDTNEETRRFMRERLSRNEGFEVEVLNYRKTGEPFWVRVEVQPLLDEKGVVTGYMGIETDITDRKLAEYELQRRAYQQVAISRLSQKALTAEAPALMAFAVEAAADALDAAHAGFFSFTADGKKIRLEAGKGLPDVPAVMDRPGDEAFASPQDAHNEAVLMVASRLFGGLTVKSSLGVLVSDGEKPYGILVVGTPEEKTYSADDLSFLQSIAHVLAAGIQRSAIQEQLVAERDRAEEIARLKSEFLANMSHEIRTPLTGIIGFASVLASEVPEPHREFAALIEQGGHRLLEVLNSVLDLAKLDAHQVELDLQRLHVASVVREILPLFRPLAEQKKITLSLEEEEGSETGYALLDRGAFVRILQNLVGNALKFTNKGRVTVEVWADEQRVNVNVRDTGIGMDQSFIPHLFEEFKQESSGVTKTQEGSGLGLSITRRLVDLMNGTIRVESKKGEGSTFMVSFPRVEQGAAPEQPASNPQPQSATYMNRASVLLVEDNPDTRFLMQHLLQDVYDVEAAADGAEAQALARKRIYDLVLMDIDLGGGPDGIATLESLRRIPGYEAVPFIALTAYALPGDRERFIRAGFDNYLSKPFDIEELLQLTAGLLAS